MEREVGRLEAKTSKLEEDVREIKDAVHEIQIMLSQARGGWKTLLLIGGAAGAVGSMLSNVVHAMGLLR